MRCSACAQALVGLTADPRVGCLGCSARAVVTTHRHLLAVAMDDIAPRDARDKAGAEVREAIRRAMPGWQYEVARAEVMVWWRIDRAAARKGE